MLLRRSLSILACFAALCACGPSNEDVAKAKSLAESAVASLPARPDWRAVNVRESSPGFFDVAIDYATPPTDSQAEDDTKGIVRAILARLVKSGRQPATEIISVSASAVQTGIKGETGAELVRTFGTSSYDHEGDRVVFIPASGSKPR